MLLKKRRYTEDSRPCSAAFSFENITYLDCTNTRSPDGAMNEREWCYVEPSTKRDNDDWGYCKPSLDYDKVRRENQNLFQRAIPMFNKLNLETMEQFIPAKKTAEVITTALRDQDILESQVAKAVAGNDIFIHYFEEMEKKRDRWKSLEQDIIKIWPIKVKKEQKLKYLKEQSKIVEYINPSPDYILEESKNSFIIINMYLQQKQKPKVKKCAGMPLYVSEENGDGLKGKYYTNSDFLGAYIERKDLKIYFDWTGASPMVSLPPEAFSVRWVGYLKIPKTGNYVFYLNHNDGASMIINNQVVISAKMKAEKETFESVERILTEIINMNKNSGNQIEYESKSSSIFLKGNQKYPIVISYYHSMHTSSEEFPPSFINLKWSSEFIYKELIDSIYLYSTFTHPPLFISDIQEDKGIVSYLKENDFAFKNSDLYVLQDIPSEYRGSPSIKFNTLYNHDKLKFRVNVAAFVFLCFLKHYPRPISDEWEETTFNMSLLKIPKIERYVVSF